MVGGGCICTHKWRTNAERLEVLKELTYLICHRHPSLTKHIWHILLLYKLNLGIFGCFMLDVMFELWILPNYIVYNESYCDPKKKKVIYV